VIETYYSYREIRFTWDQVEWILDNLCTVSLERWPKAPSGYSETWINTSTPRPENVSTPQPENVSTPQPENSTDYKGFCKPARFTKPADVASEVKWRLKQCGTDGMMLKDRCIYDKTDRELEITYRRPIEYIDECIESVKKYLTGWKRKGSYQRWKWRKKKARHISGGP